MVSSIIDFVALSELIRAAFVVYYSNQSQNAVINRNATVVDGIKIQDCFLAVVISNY